VTRPGESPREFATSRIALAGLHAPALVLLAAALGAVDLAAGSLDLARLDLLDSRLPPGGALAAGRSIAWHDDRPRHAVCHPLRLRTSVAVGLLKHGARARNGVTWGRAAAWLGGWLDALLNAPSPQLRSLHPIPLLLASGKALDKIIVALSRGFNGRITPHRARARARRTQEEYIDAAVPLAHFERRITFVNCCHNWPRRSSYSLTSVAAASHS